MKNGLIPLPYHQDAIIVGSAAGISTVAPGRPALSLSFRLDIASDPELEFHAYTYDNGLLHPPEFFVKSGKIF
jgi:hypothetical protein